MQKVIKRLFPHKKTSPKQTNQPTNQSINQSTEYSVAEGIKVGHGILLKL